MEPHLQPRDVIENCDACYGSIVNSVCLFVCLPASLSVTLVRCVEMAKYII